MVCPFCGCLCDDIEVVVRENRIVEVREACALGTAKFMSLSVGERITKPLLRVDGSVRQVSLEEALKEAAKMLADAERPLLYGWSSTECGAQAVGVALAEVLGGVLDNTSSVCHGPTVLATQDVGCPSCTLGQVKNRADLIIYWGCNPMQAHPRHMSRYTTFPRGFFRERGVKDKKIVVIDVRHTETARLADRFIQVELGKDYELLAAMRAALKEYEIPEKVAGVSRKDILEVVELMKNCQFGALFFGMGLTMSFGKHRNVDNAISLVKDLNAYTKFIIMPMRGHYNVAGANTVFTWETGFPYAVDFSRGYPRYNPGETAANDVLQNEECDAALIVASDPVSHFPAKAVKHLASIPVISIDFHHTPTTEISKVVIPAAVAGVEVEGTAYRMDTVPIRLKKVVEPPEGCLPDREILRMLLEKVCEIKGVETPVVKHA